MTARTAPGAGPSPYLLLTLTMLFWAGNVVVGRAMAGQVPPVTLAALRWTVAFLVVLPFGWQGVMRDLPRLKGAWPLMTLLALLGITVFNTLYYVALTTTEATNAALVASIGPALIPLIGWLIDRTRPGAWALAGLVVALVGVFAIVVRGDFATLAAFRPRAGDLWLLVTVTVWGLYSVLLRRKPAGVSQMTFLTVTFGLGLAMLIPPAIVEYALVGGPTMDARAWVAVLYVGILPSAVAFLFWNKAVAAIGPTTSGLFIFLVPVFSAALAWAFLGEDVHLYHLIGFVLIAAGINLSTRSVSRDRPPAPDKPGR
jgi:drug/metabolite transporter (DMT)-like permease